MGYAYEEYCDAMYEKEYCMSDIDFGCSDCDAKAKELEECYDGYHLFRVELEKVVDCMVSYSNGNNVNILDISLSIFRLCDEAGFNYKNKISNLKAVI